MTEFDNFLRANRLKQTEIKDYLKCSRTLVSNMVTGQRKVSPAVYYALANNPYGWNTSMLTNPSIYIQSTVKGDNSHNDININSNNGANPPVDEQPNQAACTIPLIPIDARAGSLTGFSEGIMPYQCERIANPFPSAEIAIRINGNSMEQKYSSGDIVFCQRINEKAFIEWGRIYVLDTDNGAIIKKIEKGEKDGEVRCVSINQDYAPFDVSTMFIKGWYKVVGSLSFE